jgi:hypothetical protein
VSIFSRSRALALGALGALAFAALRCGPLDTCTRISDCSVGLTCVEGTCQVVLSTVVGEGGAAEASAVAEAAAPVDSGSATSAGDGGAGDAALATLPYRAKRWVEPYVDPNADDGAAPPDPSGF